MNKKKILWLLPYYPYPPITGGNVRLFNLIKKLSKFYDIDLLSYYDNEISKESVSALEEFCKTVKVVKRMQYEGELPLIFQYYYTPEMLKELDTMLKSNDYEFIQIDFLTMAYYIFHLKDKYEIPVFFTEHDVSSFVFEKCFHNRHLPEKERYVEWVRMHQVIDKIYPLFDGIITVSENDALILKNKIKTKNIIAAPTGTDCSYFKFNKKDKNEKINELVYVGHYIHYPNVDSVNYIMDEILPVVRKKYPEIKFNIVGSGGKEAFNNINDKNIEVTGTIPDIRVYLNKNAVFISPVRIGIGIRGKILEAMSCGMPVVTNSLGAEGIGARNKEELIVAESAEDMAERIVEIIENPNLRENLRIKARKFVETKYDWPIVVEKILKIYKKFIK